MWILLIRLEYRIFCLSSLLCFFVLFCFVVLWIKISWFLILIPDSYRCYTNKRFKYRPKTNNTSRTKSPNLLFLVSSCSCLCPIHGSQVLSPEWRCSWSNTDRRSSNYIWVINNFIAYWGASSISGLTVRSISLHVIHCFIKKNGQFPKYSLVALVIFQ